MEIRKTDDGSETLWSAVYGETYHSNFGAITESNHVFIEGALRQSNDNPLSVFEMGFGTGLNALLTYREAQQNNFRVVYHALELNPVPFELAQQFSFIPELNPVFQKLHESEWNQEISVSQNFTLRKTPGDLKTWQPQTLYHIVYFDAFSPESQPELWTEEIFAKIFQMLHPDGILTTYCAKGSVRRNLMASGFRVERLPGPPGKREMLRARK